MNDPVPSDSPLAVVVDDDAMIRMQATEILEDAGYMVHEAKDGDQAVEMLEQHEAGVQVLFTDVEMPGSTRDGFALAREVAERWSHIAIVVASGRAKPQPGDLPDGATFIRKPFSAEVIYAHLRSLVPTDIQPDPLKG